MKKAKNIEVLGLSLIGGEGYDNKWLLISTLSEELRVDENFGEAQKK